MDPIERSGSSSLPALCIGVLLSCTFGARAQDAQAPETEATAPAPAEEAPPSDAQTQALALLDQALAQIEQAEWLEAARTLEHAKKLAEFPNIVYHLARAHFRLGRTRQGLKELARFEELAGPFNPNRAEAERLRTEHATPTSFASEPSRRRLPLGPLITISGGGAALISALVTGLLANAAADELKRNCGGDSVCPDYLEDVRDRGDRLKLATNVLLGVGGAAVVAGTGWWLLGRKERARAQLSCNGEGCRASAKVEF
jgi:hypothetical protein